MSKEEFRSFLEAVNTETALQEKLKDAAEPDAVAAIAQSAGFESVSSELVADFLEYIAAQSASEQKSEQELSAVSGGLSPIAIAGIATGSAVTVLAGAAVIANCYIKSNETSKNRLRLRIKTNKKTHTK
jgi:predicted ribosomally synthesized peptide with nif11-like leader